MKILILNYEYPPLGGGAAPVSQEIANLYAKKGHQVDVVTMGYKDLPLSENVEGVNVYRVKCWRHKKEICHPWEQLSYLMAAWPRCKQLVKKNGYDVCHCHFLIPTGILALKLKRKFSLQYIVTSHGSDIPGYNPDRFSFLHKFTQPILRQVARNAKHIVSPSVFLQNLIKKNVSSDLKNLMHIPNGFDLNKFHPQTKTRTIFSSGRLLARKGFQYLIKAVSENDLGYEVHICGDGPMMPQLKDLAKKSKTKVILHGWLDNKSTKYKDLLEQASIYCLVSEKENASIALLEAMAAGCAVITSKISGCPETVGEAGILVTPADVQQLEQVIQNLVKNPGKIGDLQKQARTRLEKIYDWNGIIDKYLEALR